MANNRINFANPSEENNLIFNEIQAAISSVLKSNDYVLGPQVEIFEENFAKFIGVKHCIGVNSGTDALILALRSLGIGKSDEVITTSHTAVATVAAIIAVGATPIYVDIDLSTYNIDPSKVVDAITPQTRAIIAVHLYGNPCDLKSLCEIAKSNSLFLIEDCAQSTGAEIEGQKVGSFGDLACFSFYPTKNLGCVGDGGAILLQDSNLADKIIKLRQYGWDANRNSQISSAASRLDELQAAILNVKLKHLDQNNQARICLANQYKANLEKTKFILPETSEKFKHVYHLFVVRAKNRDSVINYLNSHQIFPGIHYKLPVHLQTAYFNRNQNLANTEYVCTEILSLPIYPTLSSNQIDDISERLIEFEGTIDVK
jgi:dTDP-4-amino-4,6-dideoxygalactose transaminase